MSATVLTSAALSALLQSAVLLSVRELVEDTGGDAPDPGPRAVPRDLRLWLARLRLLEGIPFGHLVADASLLPPESIRFFYVDRGWTDAVVEGALSVGTTTTSDRAALTALYPTVRSEVDEAERLVRLPGVSAGAAVPTGPAGTLSGFVLRSRLVSGWPAMHVRGYGKDNRTLSPQVDDEDVSTDHDTAMRRLGLLRLERLAPAVLLALFDGVPEVVHLEEPRAGIQFGVDEDVQPDGRVAATVVLRDPTTARRLEPPATVRVPFRRGAPGVLHLQRLSELMVAEAPALGTQLDSAEFAMQMLQFPYRAVFGDRTLTGGSAVPADALFTPTVGLAVLRQMFTRVP